MGVKKRNKNNIQIANSPLLDETIKNSSPRLIKKNLPPIVGPLTIRDEVLSKLTGAVKIAKFADYLDEHDEKFYLQPHQFYKYIETFFREVMRENKDKAERENFEDDSWRVTIPRISFGLYDGIEYRLGIEKFQNEASARYGLKFFRVDGNGEKLITEVTLYPSNASNQKTDNPRDKRMFKGFLKLLEVEEGLLNNAYYKVLKRQS